MKCKCCQQKVSILDNECPACGRSLSLFDSEASGAGDLLDRVMDTVESELAAEMDDSLMPSAVSAVPRPPVDWGKGVCWELGRLQPLVGRSLQASGAGETDTPAEAVQQMAQFVFFSSHVQSNLLYRQRAEQTSLHYVAEDPTVSAFATDAKIDGLDIEPPMIFILGGLTRMVRLVAAALAEYLLHVEPASQQRLVQTIQQTG